LPDQPNAVSLDSHALGLEVALMDRSLMKEERNLGKVPSGT
jgi:hypothetical protein